MMRKFWIIGTIVVLALLGVGWWSWTRNKTANAAQQSEGAKTDARVVPVIVAPAMTRDVPVYLEGLGNVAAFKTVSVRAQVDGRLDSVNFKEGQEVHRGDLLAQIDPRPYQIQLHQAEGSLARDSAQLHDNKLNLDRYASLRDKKLIAQQQVDDQGAAVGQFEGAVRVDQAAIENAKLNLDYARITSPIDGVTGIRLVDQGNVVHAADTTATIVVVTQLDPISVIFTLPQDALPDVMRELAKGEMTVEAWSREPATKLGEGTLALIDNQINQATATIKLKAVFRNKQRLLWPNQFVKARLLLKMQKGALVIPSVAVQRGPRGNLVYVVGSDNVATAKPVEINATVGDLAIVQSGVKAGDSVVIDGQNQLRQGSKVQPRPLGGKGPEGGKGKEGAPEGGKPEGDKNAGAKG